MLMKLGADPKSPVPAKTRASKISASFPIRPTGRRKARDVCKSSCRTYRKARNGRRSSAGARDGRSSAGTDSRRLTGGPGPRCWARANDEPASAVAGRTSSRSPPTRVAAVADAAGAGAGAAAAVAAAAAAVAAAAVAAAVAAAAAAAAAAGGGGGGGAAAGAGAGGGGARGAGGDGDGAAGARPRGSRSVSRKGRHPRKRHRSRSTCEVVQESWF
jgi:hypothetical protein